MITVAVDTGPLYGPMTGVGRAVSCILEEFDRRPDEIDVMPYVVSRRARLTEGTRRLPFPAILAQASWAHFDRPRADRYLSTAAVVHGMNYVVPPVRVARVVSVYDTWALRHPESSPRVVNRAMNVLRRNISSGAVVHTSSRATATELQDLFPGARIHMAHLGSPHLSTTGNGSSAHLPDTLSTQTPYLLTVGTVEKRKNLPKFVRAFANSAASRTGVRLMIAGGPGDDSDELRDTIDSLDAPLRRNIIVLGRVSDPMLDTLYKNALLVVYPSLDEGFGFPILEAMARGIPVLASNRGSLPEIGADAALFTDPLDLDELSAAVDHLVSDTEARLSYSAKGLERCTQFTWESTADSLLGLYRTILDDGDATKGA